MTKKKIKSYIPEIFLAIACLVITIVGIKPVIDCAWSVRVGWGGFKTSLQGFIGIGFLALSTGLALIAFKDGGLWKGFSAFERRRLQIMAALFLMTLGVIAFSTIRFKPGIEFALKYASGAAGLFTVSWCLFYIRNDAKRLFWLSAFVLVSFAVLCGAMLLQVFGLIQWQVFDLVPWMPPNGFASWAQVPRLTGFYYHPLDVFRTGIWGFLFLLFFIFRAKKSKLFRFVLLMIAFQVLALWTTHRASFLVMILATVLAVFFFKAPKRGTLALSAIAVGWLIGVISYVSYNDIQVSSLFSKLHFVDSRFVEQRRDTLPKSESPKITESLKPWAEIGVARGRSYIWYDHIQWIADFSADEMIWGTRKAFPKGKEAEPHSQVLDLIERFGFVGLFLFIALYGYSFVSLPVTWYWKGFALAMLGWYGLITESLVMPTFTWWAMLFACVPIWAKAFWPNELKTEQRT